MMQMPRVRDEAGADKGAGGTAPRHKAHENDMRMVKCAHAFPNDMFVSGTGYE